MSSVWLTNPRSHAGPVATAARAVREEQKDRDGQERVRGDEVTGWWHVGGLVIRDLRRGGEQGDGDDTADDGGDTRADSGPLQRGGGL